MRDLSRLYAFRELLLEWTRREVRVRYSQAWLGLAWSVLEPLALLAVVTLVFTVFVRVPTIGAPYAMVAGIGIFAWSQIANAINFGSNSVVGQLSLTQKAAFPREILVIGAVIARSIDAALAGAFLFLVLLVLGRRPGGAALWLPLLAVLQVALALGVALATSALFVLFRDLRFVLPVALQIAVYASPIYYPVSLVPPWLRPLYLLNPVAVLVEGYRSILLDGQAPAPLPLAVAALVCVAALLGGYRLFKSLEPEFADHA